jgi:hypothetical protein
LGDLRLDEITFAVVEDLKIALAQTRSARCKRTPRVLHPRTINNVLSTLRHMLQIARKRGHIERLPEITRMKAHRPGSTSLAHVPPVAGVPTQCQIYLRSNPPAASRSR